MSIAESLQDLQDVRDDIRVAVVGRGGTLPKGSPMSDYADAIDNLPSGGGGGDGPVELTYTGSYLQSVLTDEMLADWDLDTSSATSMVSMFRGCSSLTSVPELDTSSATNMSSMFYGCSSLTSVPELDTSSVTNMGTMFYGCSSLTSVPELDTSSATNMGSMFYGCSSLETVGLYGFHRSLSVAYTALGTTALDDLFTQAGTPIANQTITITGTPGAATCDKTIATNKGWTVID